MAALLKFLKPQTVPAAVVRFGHWLAYLLVRVLISIIQALSIETCLTFSRGLACLFYDLLPLRRKIVDANLEAAFPEKTLVERQRQARRMWEHLFLMICEIAHAPRKIHETNWQHYVSRTPRHREMVQALLMPRPKVIVTAHFGNFEVGGYLTGLLGFTAHTVARTLDNPFLDAYLTRFRESQGQFMLPKAGSAPQADAVLNSGGILVLLGDQHAGDKGCWIEFMGRPASCHKALALFTLLNSAPMLVMAVRRTGKPLHFELAMIDYVDPQIPAPHLADVTALTQWYNASLEQAIRQSPDQYWWVHNRWREHPKKRREKVRNARQVAAPADIEEHRPAA